MNRLNEYTPNLLEAIWSDVGTQKRLSDELVASEIPVEVAGGRVLLGTGSDGFRRILFPLPVGGPCVTDERSARVQLHPRELVSGSTRYRFVELVCLRPALSDVFNSMLVELITDVQKDASRPDLKGRELLVRWRQLIRAGSQDLLSPGQIIGLTAELLVFQMLCEREVKDPDIWTGPDKARHDFMFTSGDLEIKGTTSSRGWRCRIHGPAQLDPPENGSLDLILVRLERSPSGDISVPNLVASLVATGVDPQQLADKVSEYGVLPDQMDRYRDTRFRFRELAAFNVDREFPKISENRLIGGMPVEVEDLEYSLDLTGRSTVDVSAVLDRLQTGNSESPAK